MQEKRQLGHGRRATDGNDSSSRETQEILSSLPSLPNNGGLACRAAKVSLQLRLSVGGGLAGPNHVSNQGLPGLIFGPRHIFGIGHSKLTKWDENPYSVQNRKHVSARGDLNCPLGCHYQSQLITALVQTNLHLVSDWTTDSRGGGRERRGAKHQSTPQRTDGPRH